MRRLLTAGADGAARLWPSRRSWRLTALPAPGRRVAAIAVAAGTGEVATAGADGTVRVWTEKGSVRLRLDAARSGRSRRDLPRRQDRRRGRRRRHGAALARRRSGDGRSGITRAPARAAASRPTAGTLATGASTTGSSSGTSTQERVAVPPGAASVEGVAFEPGRSTARVGRRERSARRRGRTCAPPELGLRHAGQQSFRLAAFVAERPHRRSAACSRRAPRRRRASPLVAAADADTSAVEGLAFAPDGATFVTASLSGTRPSRTRPTASPSRRCVGHQGPLDGATFLHVATVGVLGTGASSTRATLP